MDKKETSKILSQYNVDRKVKYFETAFSRNIGILTPEEQKKLSRTKVAIPGMGGVGGVHLITLVRSGFGNFHIADFDIFEPVNVNRQYGARVPDFGRPKIEVMKEQALSINPFLEMQLFDKGLSGDNLDAFLDGVDVVIDGLDFFQFEIRRRLFKRAAEKGIYVITAGPMGFSSAMLVFSPTGMGFDEYFNINDRMTDEEKYLSFALGLSPKATHIKYMNLKKVSLESKAGPSMNAACQICAGMAATEAIRIVLNRKGIKPVPFFVQFDPYLCKLKKGRLWFGNKNPRQQAKMKFVSWMLKKNKPGSLTTKPEKPIYDAASFKSETSPQNLVEYIIRAGIQAPSGDNAQPWQFSTAENRIKLFLDRAKDQSFFNVNQIASLISCGAALENMRIAAASFGFGADIQYEELTKDLAASVTLKKDDRQTYDPLTDHIWARHTNRKFYQKKSIPNYLVARMHQSIQDFPGTQLKIITDGDKLKTLAKIIYRVDRIRTEHRPLHEHLMHMIRFSDEEMTLSGDGLPLKNLEAGFAGEQFLKLTRPWKVMNIMNKMGIGRLVALHSYQGILNSSGVGLLTVDGCDTKDYLTGGRALQRMWLTLTLNGIQMQPMTAITLFLQRIHQFGLKNTFDLRHQKILDKIEPGYNHMFKLEPSQSQIMLFRFGFANSIECRTHRRHFENFLK